MIRVALSLGANLGDRLAALQFAVQTLTAVGVIVALSDVYSTDPVGGPDQPDYYNAVVVLHTDAEPMAVLECAHDAEQGKGRTREVRWGPRTLDVDVLAYGQRVSDDPVLTLPHPRALERAFVMVPWAQVDPGFLLPDGRTVGVVAAGLPTQGIRHLGAFLLMVDQ